MITLRTFAARLVPAIVATACSSNPTSSGGPAVATSLALSGFPSSVSVGAPANVTVTAKDASGHTVTGYTGTVVFTSTDGAAVLPANYPFVGADAGSHGFAVTFENPLTQTLTATDAITSSIRGSAMVNVTRTLYVANAINFTVTGYAAGTTGNAAPALAIVGLNTTIDWPLGIARDATGKVYVVNHGTNSITVYAPGATGDATPVATIMGANTGLDSPLGLALDAAGRLYVVNYNPNTRAASITVYAAGATGNATPVATIAGSNTGLKIPQGIALDGAGRSLYVTNYYNSAPSYHSIAVYPASATGNVAPTDSIVGDKTCLSWPVAIALDSAGRIYVGNYAGSSITVYAAGASGNVGPIDSIGGSNTGLSLVAGVAVDPASQVIYVADYNGSIFVYRAGATGNVAPLDTISGSNTQLYGPSFITF